MQDKAYRTPAFRKVESSPDPPLFRGSPGWCRSGSGPWSQARVKPSEGFACGHLEHPEHIRGSPTPSLIGWAQNVEDVLLGISSSLQSLIVEVIPVDERITQVKPNPILLPVFVHIQASYQV